MAKFLLAVTFLFYTVFASGQQPKTYSFTHYTTGSGLLSNQVNTIVQDADGYIWTGTTDGLQRFDGTRYKTFSHTENDSSSIPSNPVWQLLTDKKQRLWVMLSDGKVGVFNTRTFRFREVPVHFKKPVTPNTSLKRLIADEYGHVFYLLSGSEISTLDENSNEFSYKHNFFKQNADWDIIDFAQEPGTKNYWISTRQAGLAVYNATTGQLSYAGNNIEKLPLIDQYSTTGVYDHLFFDRRHRLWWVSPGASPAVNCYDLGGKLTVISHAKLTGIKNYHEIKCFFQQSDGTVWVNGLLVFAKYQEKEKQFQPVYNGYINEQSISYEMVHCLYEDREKNTWVGTDNNGLYRFNPATEFFRSIKHIDPVTTLPGKGKVLSFSCTRWGTVLAGVWGDGLYEYDKDFNALPLSIKGLNKNTPVIAWNMLAAADSSKVWIGAETGIGLLDQNKRTLTWYQPAALKNETVRQIAEDKNGGLWLGTAGSGVYTWNAAKGKNKFEAGIAGFAEIPPVQVNKITADSKGLIWVGTPENGVYVIEAATQKITLRFSDSSTNEKKLPERGVSSILEYNDSLIIITTATRIFCYNRILHQSYVIGAPGMISGFITAVQKDNAGYLWLTSTSGLYRINIRKKIFVKFGRQDGIDNEHFIQSATARLPDGKLLFGTTNDILVFNPGQVKTIAATPDIQVTDCKIMGKSVPAGTLTDTSHIILDYQDNSLAIEFSPLTYNSPYHVKYKLENLDKNWKTAGRNNEAIYNYLPPGEYNFQLKTMDEEGRESDVVTRLLITVRPPFWKTWWFYSLLALALGGLLFWLDKERMKRKAGIQKMRTDIADNLYQDVQTVLGNINILSEIAKLKADKEPEKSKDYIQQINTKSEQMIVAMDDMLWGMNPGNDSMQKTIERIREHIDSVKKEYNVRIDLLVDEKVEALKLNMKLRQHVFLIIKNSISNLVKTGATGFTLHIAFEKAQIVYTVEFDHAGADMQHLNNLLQRQELAKKLDMLHGKLSMQLQKTTAIIRLSIPV